MSSNNNYKLKSSFTGIHTYSGQRGHSFPSIYDWLETKKRDDNIGNLWRVHDKLYDLHEFIDKHPGGQDWIKFTQGTDITEAFEASHVVNTKYVENLLAKYFVKNAQTPRNSPYTFKENGFYKTLKRRIEPKLKEIGIGPTKEAFKIQDGLALTFVILSLLSVYKNSLAGQLLSGFILSLCTTAAHNFFHKKDHWRMYYFDLSLLSSYEWRISHAFSHHLFPNTILDFEVAMGEPMIEMLPLRPRNWFQKSFSFIYYHVLIAVHSTTDVPKRALDIYKGKAKLRPENFIPLLELMIFVNIAPSLGDGFLAWMIIQMTCSFWFVYLSNNSAHHHPLCFHDGDEARKEPDFGLCQLDATAEKTDWYHKPLFSVMTTFGAHPLHHLFPTVCHSKLQHLRPIVQETIVEFSEQYPELTQLQLYFGTFKQMSRTKPHTVNQYKYKKW